MNSSFWPISKGLREGINFLHEWEAYSNDLHTNAIGYYKKYYLEDACLHESCDYDMCKNVYYGVLTQRINAAVKSYITAFMEVVQQFEHKSEKM